jgi:hypothetical protein
MHSECVKERSVLDTSLAIAKTYFIQKMRPKCRTMMPSEYSPNTQHTYLRGFVLDTYLNVVQFLLRLDGKRESVERCCASNALRMYFQCI